MFTLTIFEILLFEERSLLRPAQRVTGSDRLIGDNVGKGHDYLTDFFFDFEEALISVMLIKM